jgi:lantibiotic modifying enzyme
MPRSNGQYEPTVNAIHQKLEEIAMLLAAQPPSADISLTGGDAGRALFLLYYHKLSGNEAYLDKAIELMNDLLVNITQSDCHPSFAGGLAGVGWLLQHAVNNGFLDADMHALLGKMDDVLREWMMTEIQKGNYDYLYGATGVALYMLGKTAADERYTGYLSAYIRALEEQAIAEQEMIKWKAFLLHEGMYGPNACQDIFNLGLSHGIPSIISFLVKAGRQPELAEPCSRMIRKSCRYLQHHMRAPEEHGSYFGYLVNSSGTQTPASRLAWCYGDLGVCTTLWQAGEALQQEDIKAAALEIGRFNARKRDLAAGLVQDACFCHGTSGIAHIYHKMYRHTGEPLFSDAADFWYKETLAMATFEDGLAGYKTYMGSGPDNGEWYNVPGLLEGVSGIGLSLISAVAGFEPVWDEALLLS